MRTMLIHRTNNSKSGLIPPSDLQINITKLASEVPYQSEGEGLAVDLWNNLPSQTVDALIKKLNKLQSDDDPDGDKAYYESMRREEYNQRHSRDDIYEPDYFGAYYE